MDVTSAAGTPAASAKTLNTPSGFSRLLDDGRVLYVLNERRGCAGVWLQVLSPNKALATVHQTQLRRRLAPINTLAMTKTPLVLGGKMMCVQLIRAHAVSLCR